MKYKCFFHIWFILGEKPSGREVKIRQEFLEERLKERFEEKAGCTIQQVKALSLVGEGNTSETSKTMLTRALKRAFPSVETKRTQEKGYPLIK